MAPTDVTPQELRDLEIREAWRGYHRDDVDELLERAAATIEHLVEQARQLQIQLTRAPGPQARPPAPERLGADSDTEVIQRTLLLAQRAADEAVAEAKAQAAALVAESEQRAGALVSEAEARARAIGESERQRLDIEIAQLAATREALSVDVEALERFKSGYRERLHMAIEAELETLTAIGMDASERPSLHEVEMPLPRSAPAPAPAPVRPTAAAPARATTPEPPSWSASSEAGTAMPDAESTDSTDIADLADATEAAPVLRIDATPARADMPPASGPGRGPDELSPEPPGGWSDAPTAAVVEHPEPDDTDGASAGDDSLDDDAFFASLREAVRDDAPLGGEETGEHFFERERPEDQRRLFRRRREG